MPRFRRRSWLRVPIFFHMINSGSQAGIIIISFLSLESKKLLSWAPFYYILFFLLIPSGSIETKAKPNSSRLFVLSFAKCREQKKHYILTRGQAREDAIIVFHPFKKFHLKERLRG